MLRLTECYGRATAHAVAGETISVETSNLGAISQFVLSFNSGTRTSGTGVASYLESCLLDIMLESNEGVKIVDSCSLAMLAGVADIEGGAVRYNESAAGSAAADDWSLSMCLPIGNFIVEDETMKVRLTLPANAFVPSGGNPHLRFGFLGDGSETESGIWCYEGTSLVFAGSNVTLEKQNQRGGVMATYLHDPSDAMAQFSIVPSNDRPSTGSRDLLRAATLGTESLEIGLAISASSDSWLKTFKVFETDALSAHTDNLTIRCLSGGAGTITVLNRYYHGRAVASKTNVSQLKKVAIKAAKLEATKPALAKVLRHTGVLQKSGVYASTAQVFSKA